MKPVNFFKGLRTIGLVLFILAIGLPAAVCPAQEQSVPLPEFYPKSFSGHGCIDRITADFVVIDDRTWHYARGAGFHTPKKPQATWKRFRKGYRVGYIKSGQKEIESLWYISKCK